MQTLDDKVNEILTILSTKLFQGERGHWTRGAVLLKFKKDMMSHYGKAYMVPANRTSLKRKLHRQYSMGAITKLEDKGA